MENAKILPKNVEFCKFNVVMFDNYSNKDPIGTSNKVSDPQRLREAN